MKFVLLLLCLLTLAFSEYDEQVFEYSKYYEEYGCPLRSSKCCWKKFDDCCAPASGPRTCATKLTLCCKKKVYDMGEGSDVIVFFHN